MIKFQAPYRRLEVVSIGAHIPYYLNRNVILLLGVHGVRDALFLDMQRIMLDVLDRMLRDARTAADVVPRLSGPDSTLTAAIVHMISAGLSPDKEPFLFSALHAIRAHHLTNLRKKSRIFVKDGAVLIGGLDETGLVPEGCVFVQVRHGVGNEFKPLVGPVMVTKHPVMHPGDVRMLLAVDKPELRDHKNVILFSQWGTRPEADKMAGSDLDGDQFAVTWDSRLFLNEWNCCSKNASGVWTSGNGSRLSLEHLRLANADPMDFTAPPTVQVDNEGTIGDQEIIQHFINHAKSDNLGRIAMMWLDHAAKSGANCDQCLKLAGLHSIAVDFPKSGTPAIIPRELFLLKEEPRPHWRERKDIPSYHCRGVVGKLYDEVVDRGSKDVVAGQPALAGRILDQHGQILCYVEQSRRSPRILFKELYQPYIAAKLGWKGNEAGQPENDEMVMEANSQRREYDQELMSLMSKYHLHSEGELLTGCIRKYHRLNKRRQHDLSEEVKSQCRELRKRYRRAFFEEVLFWAHPQHGLNHLNEEELEELLMIVERMATDKMLPEGAVEWGFLHHQVRKYARKLAGAMYMVTYDPVMRLRDHADVILFSFPWIVADVIAHGVNDPAIDHL
jgi:RNA-dependent RNA polymerase